MNVKECRKALVAFLGAFLSAFATVWAQRSGWPGWGALGGCAIFAAVAGLATWAVPNARAVPPAVQMLRDAAAIRAKRETPVERMAARSADRIAGAGQKPAAVINVPPRPRVAPAPPAPSGLRPGPRR